MCDLKLDAALRESLSEALEQMFFVRDLGEGVPGSHPAGPELIARVDFVGNPSGWLALRAPLESARSLAADFLGEDEESIGDQQTGEVLAELANIVCGAILTRTETSSTFHLSSPRLLPEVDFQVGDENTSEFAVALPNGPITAFLKTEAAQFHPERSAY
jgi:hypothetical protein